MIISISLSIVFQAKSSLFRRTRLDADRDRYFFFHESFTVRLCNELNQTKDVFSICHGWSGPDASWKYMYNSYAVSRWCAARSDPGQSAVEKWEDSLPDHP
jgi:hypothetical protein